MPFEKTLNEAGRQEVAEATQLGPEQIEFVRCTAEWYKSMGIANPIGSSDHG